MDFVEAGKFFSEVIKHVEIVEIPKSLLKLPSGKTTTIPGYHTAILNEDWERKNIKSLVTLFNFYLQIDNQLDNKINIRWADCSEDEASLAKNLIGEAIEKLESRFFSLKGSETVTLSRHDADALFEAALFPSYLNLEKPNNSKFTGRQGGLQAAKNRAEIREKLVKKIKEDVARQRFWNDFSQTLSSITDTIWLEIQNSIESGKDWQDIPNSDLQQAKVGRQTVYNAVMETDHR